MGIRDCAKKECQEEASVDEDTLDKNLMSVASSLLFCYSVQCAGGHDPQVMGISRLQNKKE